MRVCAVMVCDFSLPLKLTMPLPSRDWPLRFSSLASKLAFSESVPARFEGLGWNVLHVADANDTAEVGNALGAFRACKDRPTLIVVRSHIAWGAPNKQDTAEAHGSPLGEKEVALTKEALGWPKEPDFFVPDDVLAHFREAVDRGLLESAQDVSGGGLAVALELVRDVGVPSGPYDLGLLVIGREELPATIEAHHVRRRQRSVERPRVGQAEVT